MGEFYHLGYPTNKMGDLYLLLLWNVEDGSTGLGMNRQLQTAHWISVWYRYYLWVEHRNLTNGLNRSKIHHESIWFKIQQFNAMRMKMSECLTKGNLEKQWCSKWYWVRSEEHTSELQSRETISYAVFCLKKKKTTRTIL